jgi:hypothetical protein
MVQPPRLCYFCGMAESHKVYALRKKQDEIRGVICRYEALLRRAQQDLAHINAALYLFEAAGRPADYPAYVDLSRVYKRGETTRICLEALKEEGPLDTRELGLRVMRAKGIDETDAILRNGVNFRVIHALSRLHKKRQIIRLGKTKRAFVWQINQSHYCTNTPGALPAALNDGASSTLV